MIWGHAPFYVTFSLEFAVVSTESFDIKSAKEKRAKSNSTADETNSDRERDKKFGVR